MDPTLNSEPPTRIPYRLALAGGWIDQPFISKLNPEPPGSMVVVQIKPTVQFMHRAGMATGTRAVANRIWNGRLPNRPAAELVRELYDQENRSLTEPSGSQDMVGLIYPGVSRLDFDHRNLGGIFPSHIESNNDQAVARWVERVIHIIPVQARPEGYNPIGIRNLDPKKIAALGHTGRDCYHALISRSLARLGASMNRCMECWASLLPNVVSHPTIKIDLMAVLRKYQSKYAGAMFSGCGGGYLYVVSEEPVPGSFQIQVRTSHD